MLWSGRLGLDWKGDNMESIYILRDELESMSEMVLQLGKSL